MTLNPETWTRRQRYSRTGNCMFSVLWSINWSIQPYTIYQSTLQPIQSPIRLRIHLSSYEFITLFTHYIICPPTCPFIDQPSCQLLHKVTYSPSIHSSFHHSVYLSYQSTLPLIHPLIHSAVVTDRLHVQLLPPEWRRCHRPASWHAARTRCRLVPETRQVWQNYMLHLKNVWKHTGMTKLHASLAESLQRHSWDRGKRFSNINLKSKKMC